MSGASHVAATDADPFRPVLAAVATGRPFSVDEARNAFGLIMDGAASEAQIAAFLMGLRVRGERQEELLGAVLAVRSRMLAIEEPPPGTIDVCGTGGDGHGTLNVSTAVAFVVSALGVPVAKHGNRALSSLSGASDVLGALGVPLESDCATLGAELRERRLIFMAAPSHHPAMRHAAGARRALGVRTLFNLVGPLANPARVTRQLVGVPEAVWLEPVVTTLRDLGSERVWAVCGEVTGAGPGVPSRGVDEVTLSGPTEIAALENGEIIRTILTPDMAGLPSAPISAIAGGGPVENAEALLALLKGAHGPYRDTVLLNAACALHVAGRGVALQAGRIVPEALRELVALAAHVIDNGAALSRLQAARNGGAEAASDRSGSGS